MNNFSSIGTDKLSIGRRDKMGTRTLDRIIAVPFKNHHILDKIQTAVVLIRDVINKWKSGYKQELREMIPSIEEISTYVNKEQPDTQFERTLDSISLPFKQYRVLDKTQTTVVLIRDVIDKWKSGYKQELEGVFTSDTNLSNFIEQSEMTMFPNALHIFWHRLEQLSPAGKTYYTTFTDTDEVTKVGLEVFGRMHDYYGDSHWMIGGHARFWKWNDVYKGSLWDLSMKPNVYFLDLKNLSNPKFLKWLQEKDEKWKELKEIPYGRGSGKTLSTIWPQMELLWNEYNNGKILKGKTLASPFFDDGAFTKSKFDLHLKLCKFHQESVDYIRNNNERYLRISEM